jgi:hypothetical protein
VPLRRLILKPSAAPACERGGLNEVELSNQAITASRTSGVPALGEANLDFVEDQPLLGLGGFTGEVQHEQPGPVGFDWIQVEVDPLLGDKTSRIPPLQCSTGPMEAEDILPFWI